MPKNKSLRSLDKDTFLSLLAPDDRERIFSDSGLRGALGFVVFESANAEDNGRTVIPVGPQFTYKSVAELRGAWLGEEPTHKVATSYYLNLQPSIPI